MLDHAIFIMNKDFGLLRIDSVIELTTLSKSTIYRRIKEKLFPPQIKCGSNIAAWRKTDIIKYIEGGYTWA